MIGAQVSVVMEGSLQLKFCFPRCIRLTTRGSITVGKARGWGWSVEGAGWAGVGQQDLKQPFTLYSQSRGREQGLRKSLNR